MKNIILILLLAAVGWYGWGKYEERVRAESAAAKRVVPVTSAAARPGGRDPLFFSCDGRTACAQMTSCEEAKFFARNCPGMGEVSGEGQPCVTQWCKR